MATMRVAQVPSPGAPFEIVERPVPEPGPGTVRIKVEACGICHSDMFTKLGLFPGTVYPRVPGHEAVGVIDAVGEGVTHLSPGQRAGVGWNGGYCSACDPCRGGDFFACERDAPLRGPARRALDERDLPAGGCGSGLQPHDERGCTVSGGAEGGLSAADLRDKGPKGPKGPKGLKGP